LSTVLWIGETSASYLHGEHIVKVIHVGECKQKVITHCQGNTCWWMQTESYYQIVCRFWKL